MSAKGGSASRGGIGRSASAVQMAKDQFAQLADP